MKIQLNTTTTITTLIIIAFSLVACLRKEFDSPPDHTGYDPNIAVTHSIKDLLKLPQNTPITDDIIIAGIVNMDDRSGNYYKKICIQDEHAGIEILLDKTYLYNDYPVGRKIYVYCKGLILGNNGLNPQLGYSPDGNGNLNPIPDTEIENHIVKASFPHIIVADTFNNLALLAHPDSAANYLNKLVVIKNVQFLSGSENMPYADAANIASASSRILYDCNNHILPLRTSAYANFQYATTPTENGYIIGLYTRYNQRAQLYIRDTNDVHFDANRCNDSGINTIQQIAIKELRNMHEGSTLTVGKYSISGVVISDRTNGNIPEQNIVLQDLTQGIMLRFNGDIPKYSLGDSLQINIEKTSLETFNGILQVNGVKIDSVQLLDKGSIIPKIVTIQQLANQISNFESTLVTVQQCYFNSTGIFSGSKTLNDATGSITHFTYNTAYFASHNLPQDTMNITAIVSRFNNIIQLQMRNNFDMATD